MIAEAFAIVHWLSWVGMERHAGSNYLGAWRGTVDGILMHMTLRWFEEIDLSANPRRVNVGSLQIEHATRLEVAHRE